MGFRIAPGSVVGASSGDSAAFARSTGEPAVDLTRGQIKNPPVGSGEAWFVPFSAGLVGAWSVLAMSDGVWRYVGWVRLARASTELRGKALVATLRESARLPRSGGFPDDFTVVVIEATA